MSEKERIIELWAKNKYAVMEHSHEGFIESREYLKNTRGSYEEFEGIIKGIIRQPVDKENALKSLFQVWEMVKKHASPEEKDEMMDGILDYKRNKMSLHEIKEKLYQFCRTHGIDSLTSTEYFSAIRNKS